RIWEPFLQGELGGLSDRPSEEEKRGRQQQSEPRQDRGPTSRLSKLRGQFTIIESPRSSEDEKDCDEESDIADSCHDERFHPRMTRREGLGHTKSSVSRDPNPVLWLIVIEMPDQCIGAEADSFPAKEHQQQIIGEDEEEHVADEEIHEEPVARESELALH